RPSSQQAAGAPAHEPASDPTYWSDIAPLFAEHCMRCHSEGGIAPFRLDDYSQAKSFATLIEHVTRERTMPPWSVTSDGSCGEFADSEALSDAEIELISRWVTSGAREGNKRIIQRPAPPASLASALELQTPDFQPKIQGGELAEYDEYRCFALDAPSEPTFITGYEVLPGSPEIVHHVVVLLVDPNDKTELDDVPERTNGEQMRLLDAESPDRDGWPCFGQAGEGLTITASPVVWAPGQGVVIYPNDSGVALRPGTKIIVQVHYNLADAKNRGKRDSTRVRLQTAKRVENIGIFVLQDEFLDTLFDDGEPATLPAGKASALYRWSASAEEMGMQGVSEGKLYGVMPHMHQLGHKYTMTVRQPGADARCAAQVDHWDFHWQRMYFYEEPWTIRPDTELSVTCDFDTSSVSQPVKPGWGTRNEMCLATLYFTVPASAFEHMERR
ncbi:MAG TPA: cytochrome c, partial [Polyangiales bacterium]|nr:cytochrome c [Polyangiales bacterium]